MSLRKDLIKHQMSVQRLVGTQTKNIKDYLNLLKEEAKRQIVYGTKGKVLKENLRTALKDLPNVAIQSLSDIAEYENKFTARITNKYKDNQFVPVSREKIENALNKAPVGIGQLTETKNKSLSVMYSQFANRKSDDIARIISDGMIEGLLASEIARRVEERINGLHTSQARVLSDTSVNYAVSVGREELIKESGSGGIWVAFLDNSVCGFCEASHGKTIEEVGDTPPAHWGCRCHIEPLID